MHKIVGDFTQFLSSLGSCPYFTTRGDHTSNLIMFGLMRSQFKLYYGHCSKYNNKMASSAE